MNFRADRSLSSRDGQGGVSKEDAHHRRSFVPETYSSNRTGIRGYRVSSSVSGNEITVHSLRGLRTPALPESKAVNRAAAFVLATVPHYRKLIYNFLSAWLISVVAVRVIDR